MGEPAGNANDLQLIDFDAISVVEGNPHEGSELRRGG